MLRPKLLVLAFSLCWTLLAINVPLWALGTVQLISPPDNSIFAISQRTITLKWQSYQGALSYAYWLEGPPGVPANLLNPHYVGNVTEATFFVPTLEDTWWTWYIIAYSDAGQAPTQKVAESEHRKFFVTWQVPTATPTPVPVDLDFNDDGRQDGVDVFYFSTVWKKNYSLGNLPAYFDQADLVDDNEINEEDLLALKELFRSRILAQPTPVLQAPELVSPASGTKMTVDEYNNHPERFQWRPVAGATRYEVELARPAPEPVSYIITEATTILTASDDYYVTHEGILKWRVRGLTAEGTSGEWSEQRQIELSFKVEPCTPSVDLDGDGKVTHRDLLRFTYALWSEESPPGRYDCRADYDQNKYIDESDLVEFLRRYQIARRSP